MMFSQDKLIENPSDFAAWYDQAEVNGEWISTDSTAFTKAAKEGRVTALYRAGGTDEDGGDEIITPDWYREVEEE